jgi:hypothetical protein
MKEISHRRSKTKKPVRRECERVHLLSDIRPQGRMIAKYQAETLAAAASKGL